MSFKITSKIVKIFYPDGQQMLINLSQVSRIYTDNANIVFVTTEAKCPPRYSDEKTACKKVNLELSSVDEANTIFADIIKIME
jgi:hypothetical protein